LNKPSFTLFICLKINEEAEAKAKAEIERLQQERQLKAAEAAKLKSQGLDRAVARRKKEAEHKLQQAEWQSIEDSFSHRKSPFSSQK
jgi:hypothetical protein